MNLRHYANSNVENEREGIIISVIIHIGRRVPKRWFSRQASKAAGLINFSTNIFMMVDQALRLSKKKAVASGKIKFIMMREYESEDLHYQIEWIKVLIQGTPEQEKEEYDESMKLYGPLNKVFKKDIPIDPNMKAMFKTKMLSSAALEDAYKKGYGAIGDNNLASKLLEMGIVTHIELIEDYESRKGDITPDFGL